MYIINGSTLKGNTFLILKLMLNQVTQSYLLSHENKENTTQQCVNMTLFWIYFKIVFFKHGNYLVWDMYKELIYAIFDGVSWVEFSAIRQEYYCMMAKHLLKILWFSWEENVLNIKEVLTGLIMPSVVAQWP